MTTRLTMLECCSLVLKQLIDYFAVDGHEFFLSWYEKSHDSVLAVSKVLIALTISNLRNFGTQRDTSKKLRSDYQIS